MRGEGRTGTSHKDIRAIEDVQTFLDLTVISQKVMLKEF